MVTSQRGACCTSSYSLVPPPVADSWSDEVANTSWNEADESVETVGLVSGGAGGSFSLEELEALEICWKLEVAEGLLSLEIF